MAIKLTLVYEGDTVVEAFYDGIGAATGAVMDVLVKGKVKHIEINPKAKFPKPTSTPTLQHKLSDQLRAPE
jgi:shikimate kinase